MIVHESSMPHHNSSSTKCLFLEGLDMMMDLELIQKMMKNYALEYLRTTLECSLDTNVNSWNHKISIGMISHEFLDLVIMNA
jgi:hypothetical protein